ncbi:Lipid III flippase [Flavobacterium bizetiae]|uniref:Lipid III flippase n=1 Tax=Flavobacterium bizetiae TaxID=2704140 RepID=A0A6J4GSW9_9FLAO|nr:O-antigen translocase [Flavobacterium bizetiae]CAA9202085.1 Lipid III flippase [Flavobacterium bizetiae]CAD5343384.1 Lipid III flippase [Flavobacterium bizetiae]CAD5349377.1 Lipid III flippase [Flavobacterium bizetiae]
MNALRKITQTTLFKITSLNSFSIAIKIGIGLITSKVLAIFVGPAGMALVGNLRNFLTSLESISTLGFQSGIIKYVAENHKNKAVLQKIMATVFISLVFVAFVLSGVLYFFASFWNNTILSSAFDYTLVFKILALALPWYAVSVFLLAVLNGLSQFKRVIWVNIIGNTLGLLFSLLMILQFQTLGALLAIVITPALLFFVTFYFVQKEINFLQTIRLHLYDFKIIKDLLPFSLMALVSSVLGPIVYLAIRNSVIATLGIEQAGFWESMTRISTYYMLFVSTILTVYFLPKLSMAQGNQETKSIFWQYYKSILPVFMMGLVVVYFARFFIVQVLFTKEFLPVASLFFWQLIGDVFKVAFLILGYQFFAKKLTKAFIIAEVASLALLYFSNLVFMQYFGIQGVVMAQAFDNFIYLMVLCVYFRKSLF